MIIFFGPAGAGKSVQGQILAARYNWRWLSAGQLLRDTHDTEVIRKMASGELIDDKITLRIMGDAIKKAKDIDHVILDGFPRALEQAKWLIRSQPEHERSIGSVVILEVPRDEIIRRLQLRGRADDTADAIEERLRQFRQEIYPILNYFTEQGIHIAHIDGTGTVGQIHDRIVEELASCSLV